MNTDLKTKWVTALRSGDYQQGKGQLKQHDSDTDTCSFCCLGVLGDLLTKEKPDQYKWNDEEEYLCDGDNLPVYDMPSDETLADLQIPYDVAKDLAMMNDGGNEKFPESKSFLVIADYIEQTL